MVHYVQLRNTDLEMLIEISQMISDFKFRTLSRTNWQIFESQYLPKLIIYISENRFKVVTASDNIFLWIIDQICHSRRLVPGIKPRDNVSLADTELGQEVLRFCRAARFGQEAYDRLHAPNQFQDLFQ
jgi:hypothetical protein